MFQIFVNAHYDFVGKRRWFYIASAGAVAAAILSIVLHGGLNYGIDFTGGALVQVRYDKPAGVAQVRKWLDELGLGSAVIQEFGDTREYLIRLPPSEQNHEQLGARVQGALARAAGAEVEIRRLEFVGPQVGRDLQVQALYAVLAGMAGRGDRHPRAGARRHGDPGCPVAGQSRDVAPRPGGPAHDRRLFDQ
jgi:preprotein translocase subunit SecF